MTSRRIGFWLGLAGFCATLFFPAPAGMPANAWIVAGLVWLMAAWWMSEAVPLTATALLPFLILPFAGIGEAADVAKDYYSPILFLILGGAFLALAIERTGMHKRLAAYILDTIGSGGGPMRLLLGFMVASAIISCTISNTSTALIMMPMALAVLAGGGASADTKDGLSGALPMGLAFASSIGGMGTVIGSPTNAVAVALLKDTAGIEITFAMWTLFGLPLVAIGVPIAAWVVARVHKVAEHPFDARAARLAIDPNGPWTTPEKRLLPVIVIAFSLWMAIPWLEPFFPPGSLEDGTVAVIAGLALFVIPDGTGRPLLNWPEANRAPWDVIMMFGGGLALAGAMGRSGLSDWLAQVLLPLQALPLIAVVIAVVAMVVLITEFASNVATASGIMPVVASLAIALGADPLLLAMPAALAASWGFMLPAGTGPNAIAWATGRIALPNMIRAGLILDLIGVLMIPLVCWGIALLI
jgi:solute carrier family 13 (sodium-dependent dicarboxylate transporter), member 2/3/5